MCENDISRQVIGAAIEVHKYLGPGLLESVYQQCMRRELEIRNLAVENEMILKGCYKGLEFDIDYRMDMLVEGLVIVELKVVDMVLPIHKAQLLSYLKLSGKKLGLIINFNEVAVRKGISRVANGI